ncbi:MAG: nickel-dependent hydrogenase large subunit [Siculibacillus sp.]|nr:nickel-dependent hydrogenase large subunit [Siculibacillus sp.]
MTSTAAFGPGAIALSVAVAPPDEGGGVIDVKVASTRPVGFSTALFVNRPADEIPALVGRLHALCGLSHTAAAAMAIAAARGRDASAEAAARFDGLLAERLGEHLRSTFLGPAGAPPGEVPRDMLADLRVVLAATRELVTAAGRTPANEPHRDAIERARAAVSRLGPALDATGALRLPPASWAAGVAERFGPASGDVHLDADPLTGADDTTIVAALAADPTGFAAHPRFSGRRPETGPLARAAARGPIEAGRRLDARLAEIAAAVDLLAAPAAARRRALADWVDAVAIDGHTGCAAVESPRGRLHHLVRLDGIGRVAFYAILAPTEWNFGPDGPFAATIRANRPTADEAGRARVERIAAAFDPCVGFAVTVEERQRA